MSDTIHGGPIDVCVLAENRVLALLDDAERARFSADCELVELELWAPMYNAGESFETAWFPIDGIASMVSQLPNAGSIEIGTIGREGMVGLFALLADQPAAHDAVCQVPGRFLRISTDALRAHAQQSQRFDAAIRRFAQALFGQVSQTAACNRAHDVHQRCARWLLMTGDRVGRADFLLTQDVLAQMLGVRRAGVNVAARALQDAGVIRYSRGRITIVDREGLERTACPCYEIVRNDYDRLLAPPK